MPFKYFNVLLILGLRERRVFACVLGFCILSISKLVLYMV